MSSLTYRQNKSSQARDHSPDLFNPISHLLAVGAGWTLCGRILRAPVNDTAFNVLPSVCDSCREVAAALRRPVNSFGEVVIQSGEK